MFPIRLRYIFATKVTVLTKSNNMLPKAQATLLKVPVTTIPIVAITLGTSGDTSIVNTDSQLVMVGQL